MRFNFISLLIFMNFFCLIKPTKTINHIAYLYACTPSLTSGIKLWEINDNNIFRHNEFLDFKIYAS